MAASIETQNQTLGGLTKGDRGVKGMGVKVLNVLSQMGWKNIFGLVGLSWATSPTGTPATWTVKPFLIVWDAVNQTIRAYKGSAGALAEIAGADIAANDMVRVLVVGS